MAPRDPHREVFDDDLLDPVAGEDRDRPEPAPVRRRRRGWRVAVVGLLTLTLLAVGTVAGYLAFLNWRVSTNVTHREMLPDGPITADDGTVVTPTEQARSADAGDAVNILLLGSDSRDLSTDRGRSDVIVLMHIADERDRVDLIHVPRDLFVSIPGYERRNKINAAYAYGGAPLLVETLQPLIGVPIDHVAITNFDSFTAMTDAIGGVEVTVAEASPGFPEGVMRMDGETGLEFVRERYTLSQGDISRGERQMAFIKAVMQQALSRETVTNPVRLAQFVDAATENLTVDEDLSVGRMRSLGLELRRVRGDDIHFHTAPWSGIGSDDFAGSIVLMAERQMEQLREALRTDTMEDYTDEVSPRSGFGR